MATTTPTAPGRTLPEAVRDLRAEVADLLARPAFALDPATTREALVELTALASQVAALELRYAAHAHRVRVEDASGATSTGSWWAGETRQDRPKAAGRLLLARSLDERWHRVRVALECGAATPEQAAVVVRALEDLPDDLPTELVERAETDLVALCAEHDPKALRTLGARILSVVAPEIGEEHERRALERAEARAAQKRRLTLSRDGHGSVFVRATLPEAQAAMLERALLALAAPQHRNATDGAGTWTAERPTAQRLGEAFCELLERLPSDLLPRMGKVNAQVVVHVPLETLRSGTGRAWLDSGEPISIGQARRWACEAGILPAVLGGRSEVLDWGRSRRLYSGPQTQAMHVRDGGCTAAGCDWPPSMCHAHHDDPWSLGGRTDLADGRLLCCARGTTPASTTPPTCTRSTPTTRCGSPGARRSTTPAARTGSAGTMTPPPASHRHGSTSWWLPRCARSREGAPDPALARWLRRPRRRVARRVRHVLGGRHHRLPQRRQPPSPLGRERGHVGDRHRPGCRSADLGGSPPPGQPQRGRPAMS